MQHYIPGDMVKCRTPTWLWHNIEEVALYAGESHSSVGVNDLMMVVANLGYTFPPGSMSVVFDMIMVVHTRGVGFVPSLWIELVT